VPETTPSAPSRRRAASADPWAVLSPLDSADAAFRLLACPPGPLALNPGALAAGLPRRMVPVDELRVLLLHPATSGPARNKVWAGLARRALAGDPAWTVALAGMAMPGLRRAAASLSRGYRGDPADLQAEILTGFLAALRALDPAALEDIPLASRLCWAAWRAGHAHARADARWSAGRRELGDSHDAPDMPGGHPDFVLAAAVTRGILSPAQARLIGASRLEGIPLSQIAARTGVSHTALCNRRKRAEKALAAAIAAGRLANP
jgi:DNA-directed RNA polymerase specialized sigma24 family protein